MVKTQWILTCVLLYTFLGLFLGASISAGIFVFHVAVVPLIFKYSKTFRRSLIFANFVQWPLSIDYEDPSSSGIDGARNLNIEYHSKIDRCPIRIGIWHILPKSTYERMKGSFEGNCDKEQLNIAMDEELANSKTPVILYCHGNSNSRAAWHRIQLYKFFQQMDFHTIAFDYRGYGDSTNLTPSEGGVVEDSLIVYDWLNTTLDKGEEKPPVFVWGHSLGTGISSHLLGNLKELSCEILERSSPLPQPNGLILESPFNNIADEVANHPLAKLVIWLPYFENTFVDPFRARCCEHAFVSDVHLARARSLPVLVLHAKDDVIVPFVVGKKLYKAILESRSEGDAAVTLHAYDSKLNLGHKWICTAPDLPDVIRNFVKTHR
ncbi:PREDICTED: monoacylglycerol lipase ABHD12-like isoform X1 [Papilio xuthus]|uniref:Monoacylglycerol lipase ABHD12-like isoform X1 n=1 Tax=Papilio xuthus TaxID=66420 RepID=A0AAJ6ZSV9_PAPXU|nr:PREDICTED: monoacylglycerol lipase ABHD12-like isoform X1 [Papilio xuthus]